VSSSERWGGAGARVLSPLSRTEEYSFVKTEMRRALEMRKSLACSKAEVPQLRPQALQLLWPMQERQG